MKCLLFQILSEDMLFAHAWSSQASAVRSDNSSVGVDVSSEILFVVNSSELILEGNIV